MNEIIKQTFEGQNITFKTIDGVVYVNATEMAKPFGKFVANWMDSESTKEYLEKIALIIGKPIIKLVIKQAGRYGGTWMHEDVAMEFARWLEPTFSIWMNKQIKTLLTTGKVELANTSHNVPKTFAEALRLAAEQAEMIEKQNEVIATQCKALDDASETIERQVDTIAEQSGIIEEQKPKVEYYDWAMNSEGLYRTTSLAKEYGMSAQAFNIMLRNYGIQYNVNGQWVLYAKYSNKGYTKSVSHAYTDNEGVPRIKLLTCWTERGREFLHGILTKEVI